jgi:hypothetical protein
MKIVKLTNDNVVLTDDFDNVLKRFDNGSFIELISDNSIEIHANSDKITTIYTKDISATRIDPGSDVSFNGNAHDLIELLSDSFFFKLSTGGSQNLSQVLSVGNSAGAYDIDLNNNDLLNTNTITAIGDLTLNPVGSINCNGKTINLTGGEIHRVPLIHSQNNVNLVIEGKGTAHLVLKTNNVNRLSIEDNGVTSFNNGILTGVGSINGLIPNISVLVQSSPNATHTGNTNNTLVYSKLISANVVSANDCLQIATKFTKPTGSSANPTVRLYINTTSSLSGATLLATYLTTNLNGRFFLVERTANVETSTTNFISATSSALTDSASLSTVAPSDVSIDWTINQYFIVAIQLGNAGDSTTLRMANIILSKSV